MRPFISPIISPIVTLGALCATAILVAGCATPASHFYTLSKAEPTTATAAAMSSNVSVVVGPISIPAIVDLPQIVVSTGPNTVSLNEFNRWASPLQSNISRVVAENLATMLGTPRIGQFQQSLNLDADYRVAIEVQSFDSVLGEAATLNAVWTVRRTKDGKAQTGRTSVREPTGAAGYDALAAAHSRALAKMSQEIADAVRGFERTS
jgi:uncharacterized protein